MKTVHGIAALVAAGFVAVSGAAQAQACRQTIDMTPVGGQKMVQCHEVTEMPPETLDQMCRPTGNQQVRSVPEKLTKCPASYVGICATPLRTVQANIRRMQRQEPSPEELNRIPEKASIKAYFYEGAPPNAADICARTGGSWTAGKAPAARSPAAKPPAKKE